MNETIALSDIFLLANVLARKAVSGGDVNIQQLAAAIGAQVVRLTLDSDPDDIHAVIALLDGLNATMDRLARDIGTINTGVVA